MPPHLLQGGRAQLKGDVVELPVSLGAEIAHHVGMRIRLAQQPHLTVHQTDAVQKQTLHGHVAPIKAASEEGSHPGEVMGRNGFSSVPTMSPSPPPNKALALPLPSQEAPKAGTALVRMPSTSASWTPRGRPILLLLQGAKIEQRRTLGLQGSPLVGLQGWALASGTCPQFTQLRSSCNSPEHKGAPRPTAQHLQGPEGELSHSNHFWGNTCQGERIGVTLMAPSTAPHPSPTHPLLAGQVPTWTRALEGDFIHRG